MVLTEIILIVIGVVAFVASFFVTEKLSQKDLDQITLMSETDLKLVAEKQVKDVKRQVEKSIEEMVEESLEVTWRSLDKETNQKIMAVSEYSDTVLAEINKTHNEIMFLYSMLNDKQAEAAGMISDLQRAVKQVRELDVERTVNKVVAPIEKNVEQAVVLEEVQAVVEEPVDVSKEKMDKPMNKNEQILLLYKEGKNEVEIAKALDCGLGEIRLVLGLYHEA